MGIFVKNEKTAVTHPDSPGNTVYIRSAMSKGVRARIVNDIIRMGGNDIVGGEDGAKAFSIDIGLYSQAILRHCIVDWDGPAFEESLEGGPARKAPVTPQNIDALPDGDPLIDEVVRECGRRYRRNTDPKSVTTSTTPGEKP